MTIETRINMFELAEILNDLHTAGEIDKAELRTELYNILVAREELGDIYKRVIEGRAYVEQISR